MTPLDRALALAEVHDVAVCVAEDLHLDVTRLGEIALEEDCGVPEGRLSLAARGLKGLSEVLGTLDDAHALASAAGRRLDQQRVADLGGHRGRIDTITQLRTRHEWHSRRGREPLRLDLERHRPDRLRRRPDPRDASRHHPLGEAGILREEAVAGVNRISTGAAYGVENLLDIEVRLGAGRAAQRDGDVGLADEGRVGIGLGEDRDGLDAHGAGRAEDAACDLAAIGHQDALHRHHIRKTP